MPFHPASAQGPVPLIKRFTQPAAVTTTAWTLALDIPCSLAQPLDVQLQSVGGFQSPLVGFPGLLEASSFQPLLSQDQDQSSDWLNGW